MKAKSLGIFGGSVLLFMCLGLTSCSNPEKTAMKTLSSRDYTFTAEDYIAAASSGDIDSVQLFHTAGMNVDATDANGNTALIQSAMNGRKDVVEMLLGTGADPTIANSAGRDALISASAKGYDDVARLLIERGADVNAEDEEGWIPLSIAAYNGHSNIVELLSGEASQEQLNDSLLLASFSGDAAVIRYLLGQGAYINGRSPEGQTPLMIAAQNGNQEAVRMLLQNQANPYSLNESGQTAATIAETSGFTDIRDLIMNPNLWGESQEGSDIKEEMNAAQVALLEGAADEVLDEVEVLSEDFMQSQDLATNNIQFGISEDAPQAVPDAKMETTRVSQPSPINTAFARSKMRQQVQESAKTKPMVALNGSTISSRSAKQAPVDSFVLAGYREQPLPVMLAGVEGDSASIKMLSTEQQAAPVSVQAGQMIPGTDFKVQDVTKKFVASKEGKGEMVDVSRATIQNTQTGSTHLLVKDVSGYSSDAYAVLTSPGSDYRYVVKTGDVFRTNQPGLGEVDYQVLDIRPNGVVVKDLSSEKVSTISRDGVR